MNPPADPAGKTPRAISERTDGVPVCVGSACICTASHETPTNIAIAIVPENRERRGGVLPVRASERVDAVRDRLDAGQRGRAGRERAQQDEERDRADAGGHRMRHDRVRAAADARSARSPSRSG